MQNNRLQSTTATTTTTTTSTKKYSSSESKSTFIKPCFFENPEAESEDEAPFRKSLQELKDLRSQLHFAADYCEKSFLKAKQKTMVMESTKEYICRAVVTVVDHLGSVYANLEDLLHEPKIVSDTELRIHCLKQRLLTCQNYAQNLALSKLQFGGDFKRRYSHYILQKSSLEKSNPTPTPRDFSRYVASKTTVLKIKLDKEGVPRSNSSKSSIISKLLLLGNGVKKLGTDSASGVPGRVKNLSILPRSPRNHSLFFQDAKKLKRKSKTEGSKSLGAKAKNKPYEVH